ncbi:MAG: SDR family NAD(P)-dependent oxidoreductase [Pseudomonadota bacterium]
MTNKSILSWLIMNQQFNGQTIWLIGASSGIGYELAKQLNSLGAKLILSARSEDKLLELNEILKSDNSNNPNNTNINNSEGQAANIANEHVIMPFDIGDLTAIENIMAEFSDKNIVCDRVICLAAIYDPTPIKEIQKESLIKIININLVGIIYLTTLIINEWDSKNLDGNISDGIDVADQSQRQIAICGSVAGYVGLPNGQPYSASKAAIINFVESLKLENSDNIDVKLISPGFVTTPMTDKNDFKMPMIITPQQAAQHIVKGLNKKSFEIHFPKKFTWLMKIISLLPYRIKLPILKKLV